MPGIQDKLCTAWAVPSDQTQPVKELGLSVVDICNFQCITTDSYLRKCITTVIPMRACQHIVHWPFHTYTLIPKVYWTLLKTLVPKVRGMSDCVERPPTHGSTVYTARLQISINAIWHHLMQMQNGTEQHHVSPCSSAWVLILAGVDPCRQALCTLMPYGSHAIRFRLLRVGKWQQPALMQLVTVWHRY